MTAPLPVRCATACTCPVSYTHLKLFKVKRVEYDDQTGKKLREYEEIVQGTEEVYDSPSTTAQQFWLKNRMPLSLIHI